MIILIAKNVKCYNGYRDKLKPEEFMKVLNPNKLPTAPISELNATQGELKFLSEDNYNKLKRNIEKHGFDMPVTVWIDSQGEKWLLDGHQRKHVLETEGWNQPIPYLIIKAPNMTSAAERLLHLTSQYGTITQEGLDEYVAKFDLPDFAIAESTNFDGIFNFRIEPEEQEPTFEPEVEGGNRLDKINELVCPECGHHDVPKGFPKYDEEVEAEIANS